MNDENKKDPEYINTPFAFTTQQKGLTLLQQNIMTRVSAHLQQYFSKYWETPSLRFSKENPKPMMTREDIDNLPPIRVELSELNIPAGNYDRLKPALDAILSIKAEGYTTDQDGKRVRKTMNILSYIDTPVTDHGTQVTKAVRAFNEESGKMESTGETYVDRVDRTRGYIEITLNKDLVNVIFDMGQGYVSHPENIARTAKVENMPLMYYLIRHKMNNFKDKSITTAKIELSEVRDYLGMDKKDTKGNIIHRKYPTYSQFKAKVLQTALDDIRRLFDLGHVNIYFTMKEIRPRGKKTGNPSYIVFTLHREEKEAKKQQKPVQTSFLDKLDDRDANKYAAEWQEVLAAYDGPLKEILSRGKYCGARLNDYPEVEFSIDDHRQLEKYPDDLTHIREAMTAKTCLYGKIGVKLIGRK